MLPGTRLGPYEIIEPIGHGGMGEVYRARDTRLQRLVAIKTVATHALADPRFLERFEREARAVAALSHPNILAIHDVGSHEGIPYVAIELLEGETLRSSIGTSPLPLSTVVQQGVQIARGLAAAHDRGIVHRDLKPDNIFVTRAVHLAHPAMANRLDDVVRAKLGTGQHCGGRSDSPQGLVACQCRCQAAVEREG